MLVKIDSSSPHSGLSEQLIKPEEEQTKPVAAKPQQSAWGVFTTTFLTIFLAEFGDKTQLSTLLMSAESHAPWIVFCGAATAMVTTSLLGVLLGCWLATRLTPTTVEKLAGVSLLIVSMMLLWDVVQ